MASVRPTSNKVRQAVFNIVAADLPGAAVLDLFAGTGALGTEALSRGARSCTFVEVAARAAAALRTRLRELGATGAEVVESDVGSALDRFSAVHRAFDLAILDPPYGKGLADRAIEQVAAAGLVSERGWVVAEHRKTDTLSERYAGPAGRVLERRSLRRYGDTCLSVYRWTGQGRAQ